MKAAGPTRVVLRRTVLRWGGRAALAALAAPLLASCVREPEVEPPVPLPDRAAWDALDRTVRGWWDGDQESAQNANAEGTLLYLPYPYLTPGGSEAAFGEMYGWDTYFINLGLLEPV